MSWSFWRATPLQPSAALLGKHPSRPDFLREGCRGARADALDAWLVQATAQLGAAGASARLPTASFCHQLPNKRRALVGVCGPSEDSAGRAFPAAIFRELALDGWTGGGADVLQYGREFLQAAHELRQRLPELELNDVREALELLPELLPPSRAATATPLDRGPMANVNDPSAYEFLRGTLTAAPSGSSFYALSTLTTAFNGGSGPELTLDCPIRHEHDARGWLMLADRLNHGARARLSWLISDAPPRLLISIGPPSVELLRSLDDPDYLFDQLWPLTTTRQRAIEQAQASLLGALPELAHMQQCALSIRELGERLARAGGSLSESW